MDAHITRFLSKTHEMDHLPLQYFLRHTRIIQLRWCFCPWNHLSVQDVPKMDLVNLWYFRCRSPGRTWSLLERWYFMSSLVIIKTRRIKNLIGCTNIKILEKIPREICFVKWHYYLYIYWQCVVKNIKNSGMLLPLQVFDFYVFGFS